MGIAGDKLKPILIFFFSDLLLEFLFLIRTTQVERMMKTVDIPNYILNCMHDEVDHSFGSPFEFLEVVLGSIF